MLRFKPLYANNVIESTHAELEEANRRARFLEMRARARQRVA